MSSVKVKYFAMSNVDFKMGVSSVKLRYVELSADPLFAVNKSSVGCLPVF